MHTKGLIHLGFALFLVVVIPGCAITPYSEISNNYKENYKFSELIKGRCFRTTSISFLSVSDGLIPVAMTPPGNRPMTPESVEDYNRGRSIGGFRDILGILPVGIKFRVDQLFWANGDTGGFVMKGVLLNGDKAGESVDVLGFFVPKNSSGPGAVGENTFIIGPFIVPCDEEKPN